MRGKLIGKIILANFLEYRLEKFIAFIKGVEQHPVYEKLTRKAIIIRRRLSDAKILREKSGAVTSRDGVIAKIRNDMAFNFTIHYTNEAFSIQYVVDIEKLQRIIDDVGPTEEKKNDISGLLHKLRRISTRNRLMHEILKTIVEYQRAYFESDSETKLDLNLKPLSKAELARILSNEINHGRGFVIDTSRISRVTQGISIVTPQGKEVSLKTLFPSNRDIARTYIKTILGIEREDIRNGLVKRPYTDEELRLKLEREYNLSIIKRGVGYCRKQLGILPYSKRLNSHGYPPLSANFSNMYPFTILSVKKTLLPVQGYMNFF